MRYFDIGYDTYFGGEHGAKCGAWYKKGTFEKHTDSIYTLDEILLHSHWAYQLEVFPPKQKESDMTGVELIRQALNGERGDDQQKIATTGMQIVELLLRKNRDYGGSAWKRPVLAPSLGPHTAMLCRMSDKIERIQSLLEKGGNEVKDESLNDTFRDLCGYLMLYVAFEG
jgi:hypothetical protein